MKPKMELRVNWIETTVTLLFLIAFLILNCSRVQAQVANATLTGTVKDASGAVMPGVKVTVTNVATNLDREILTDQTGSYRVPALNPGEYKVEAALQGFKRAGLDRDCPSGGSTGAS